MSAIADQERFQRAIAAMDAINAADPNSLLMDGQERPKELVHAEMVFDWVRKLQPDATEALLLAARGHHIQRWLVPRTSFPKGRRAYLRWRHALHYVHADLVASILEELGYPRAIVERTAQIIRKEDLRNDPEVQTLEDALCLVFFDTQAADVAPTLDPKAVPRVLSRTWRKMSPAAREEALRLDVPDAVREAIAATAASSDR